MTLQGLSVIMRTIGGNRMKKKLIPVLLAIVLIVVIAAIFVICLSVPAIVYKATSNETVIERLHNFEN